MNNLVKLSNRNRPICPRHGEQVAAHEAQTAPCGCEWVWNAAGQLEAAPGWGGNRQGAGRPPTNFKISLPAHQARWFAQLSDQERAAIVAEAFNAHPGGLSR